MEAADKSPDKYSCRKDGIPARYVMALVTFSGYMSLYLLRLNVNIAIVAMVNYTAIPHTNITTAEECGLPAEEAPIHDPSKDGEFVWDEKIQSLVAGSFFFGYIVTLLPGGWIAERIGTKYLFAIAQTLAAVVSFCMPAFARAGVTYFILGRVLLGLSQGATTPSLQPLLARWVPAGERSSITSFIFSGAQMGTILGIPLSGYIADTLGWDAMFYIEASIALCFVVLWMVFVYESPQKHPRISDKELQYIEATAVKTTRKKSNLAVPWLAMIKSPPMWAYLISSIGYNWGFYMLLAEVPVYMKTILHFNTKKNAVLSALPYLVMWIFSIVVSQLADLAKRKKWASNTVIRKTANTVAQLGPAICLLVVAFAGCQPTLTLVVLTMAVGFQGACYSGFSVNQLDLAPNFAGTIYGIAMGIASISSWLAPLCVASLTEGQQTLAQWRIAFLVSSGVLFFVSIFFLIFGSGEEQPWNQGRLAGGSDRQAEEDPAALEPMQPAAKQNSNGRN